MTTNAIMNKHATALTTNPRGPFIQNQPEVMPDLPLSKCGRIAPRYERIVNITNDPAKALNAVEEPR